MKLGEIAVICLLWIIESYCDGAPCGPNKCVHGKCEADTCYCDPCYTGPTCELLKNKRPTFEKSTYDMTIDRNTKVDTILLTVSAIDEDKCLDTSCGCGTIIYSILDESAIQSFEINESSGEIKLKAKRTRSQSQSSFIVKATNKSPFDNTYDTTTVFINAQNASDQNILRRFQRAAAPPVVSFKLTQSFPLQNLTTIQIGQRVSFELTVTFPSGQTVMTLELFGPEIGNEPVMTLCNVNVKTLGSDLTMNPFTPTKAEGPNGMNWPYTHMVYQMTVNNKNTNPSMNAIMMVIAFDTVMMYTTQNTNGTTYFVSAGAEYLNGSQIWVGQLSYVPNTLTPKPDATYTLTGDPNLYPDRTAVFELSILGPNSYMYLNMSLYTPYNNTVAMSMCVVYRYSVGVSYSCLPESYNQPAKTSITINNKVYYPTATMNVGNLGNMYYIEGSNKDENSNTIRVKISVRVNPMIWVGSYYYFGASITNGTNVIYSTYNQVQAIPAPPIKNYTGSIAGFLDYYESNNKVGIGSPGRIVLNITVPAGTELDYKITTTFQKKAAEICGVTFLSAGKNVPCVDQINISSTYETDNNYFTQSSSIIPGVRHVKVTNNASDDILQVLIVFRPINDTRNKVGDVITSEVTLSWFGGKTTISNTYTIKSADSANISAANAPTFSYQLKGSDGNVSVGASYKLMFTMRLMPGIFYSPASLYFFMPFNNTVRVKICALNVLFAGKNILCFNRDFINSKISYSSKINDPTNYDKIELQFGTLCTSGPIGRAASIDDELQIAIYVFILPHPLNDIGANLSLSSGMMITPSQIWVGYQPLVIVSQSAATPLSTSPQMFAQRIDSTNNIVWKNDMVIVQYLIKTPPGALAELKLTISSDITNADNFGVCQIILKNQGANIPCMSGTYTPIPWSPYSKYYKSGIFSFGRIINTGSGNIDVNAFFDDNSILVEAVIKLGGNLPPTFNIIGTLNYNTGNIPVNVALTLQNDFSRFNGTISGTEPVFDMFLNNLFNDSIANNSNIAYSEAVRSIVSVQIQPSVLQSLKIIFASAPSVVNQMDVISVNVLSVGRNIPCLAKGMVAYVYQQRSSSSTNDLTSIDLGTICHRQLLPNTTIEDNKIYIEAIFRVWKVPIGNPTSLQINVLGLLNNDQIYVTRIVFNSGPSNSHITDINLLGQSITSTATVSPLTVSIGSLFVINVTILVPPYSRYKSGIVRIYSENPVGSDSYYFVGGNVNFTGAFGKNIGINPKEPLMMTLNSSRNTSQMDIIVADFGIVQNTATTYLMGQNNYSSPNTDDTISILITVKLTDNSLASNTKVLNFNAGVIFGSTNINNSLSITIKRTDTETIALNTSAILLTTKATYLKSDTIIAYVQARLTDTSTLECRNFTVYVAAPQFIKFASLLNSTYTSPGYSVQQTNLNPGGFSFIVPYFFYTEVITLVFSMTVDSPLTLSRNRGESPLTIPVIYGCQTLNWPSNSLGNKWISNADSLLMAVKGEDVTLPDKNQNQNQNPKKDQNCNDDLKVSDNSIIKDCAISAFMSPNTGNDASKVRKNSGSYWSPHVRSGQYNKLRYIDIKFGIMKQIAKVIITSSIPNKPQVVNIYGTMDGRSFSFYKTAVLTYTANDANVILTNPDFIFRGIRIGIANASQDDKPTGMNVDLFGCDPKSYTDTNKFDPCAVKSYTVPMVQLPEYYNRGFLYVAPYLFVCDDIASKTDSLETYPRCFRTKTPSTSTWEDMGNQVGKVVGFDSVNKIIYAISWDLNGYIMSEDDGLTWTAINSAAWQIIKAVNNLQSPTVIPWTNDALFDPSITGTSCTKYTASTLYFCYDGIYSTSQRLFTWNNCC